MIAPSTMELRLSLNPRLSTSAHKARINEGSLSVMPHFNSAWGLDVQRTHTGSQSESQGLYRPFLCARRWSIPVASGPEATLLFVRIEDASSLVRLATLADSLAPLWLDGAAGHRREEVVDRPGDSPGMGHHPGLLLGSLSGAGFFCLCLLFRCL